MYCTTYTQDTATCFSKDSCNCVDSQIWARKAQNIRTYLYEACTTVQRQYSFRSNIEEAGEQSAGCSFSPWLCFYHVNLHNQGPLTQIFYWRMACSFSSYQLLKLRPQESWLELRNPGSRKWCPGGQRRYSQSNVLSCTVAGHNLTVNTASGRPKTSCQIKTQQVVLQVRLEKVLIANVLNLFGNSQQHDCEYVVSGSPKTRCQFHKDAASSTC